MVNGNAQFFRGVCAYFVEAGVLPRRLKVWHDKLEQFGGQIGDRLSRDITHVFALDIDRLQERVPLRKLKRHHLTALKYEWIQDCLKEGFLMPVDDYVLKVEPKPEGSQVVRKGQVDGDGKVALSSRQAGKVDDRASSVEKTTTDSSIDTRSDDAGMEVLSLDSHEGGSPSSRYLPPNLNENITGPFTELKNLYKDALGDDRRSFSYYKAVNVIEKLPFKIENVDQVKGFPTIGKSLLEHINEIVTTGKLSKLENFKNDEKVRTLSLFSSIWGIGPATALKLYEKGHRTLDDLKNEPSLTATQRVGLQFYHDLNMKIPRHEIKEMEKLVREVVEEIQPGINVLCGGSYRRGKALCGDMDFVITHPDGSRHVGLLAKLVPVLKKKGFLAEDLLVSDTNSIEGTDSGVDTYYGLCKYPGRELRHRIDFKVYSYQMYPFGLIAWTGNDVLNRKLRLLAESKGFTLDDTGLYPFIHDRHGKKTTKRGTSVACKSEREVFEFLGFPWLEPHERNL